MSRPLSEAFCFIPSCHAETVHLKRFKVSRGNKMEGIKRQNRSLRCLLVLPLCAWLLWSCCRATDGKRTRRLPLRAPLLPPAGRAGNPSAAPRVLDQRRLDEAVVLSHLDTYCEQ